MKNIISIGIYFAFVILFALVIMVISSKLASQVNAAGCDQAECEAKPCYQGANVCIDGEVRNWWYCWSCVWPGVCLPIQPEEDLRYHSCSLLPGCCPAPTSTPTPTPTPTTAAGATATPTPTTADGGGVSPTTIPENCTSNNGDWCAPENQCSCSFPNTCTWRGAGSCGASYCCTAPDGSCEVITCDIGNGGNGDPTPTPTPACALNDLIKFEPSPHEAGGENKVLVRWLSNHQDGYGNVNIKVFKPNPSNPDEKGERLNSSLVVGTDDNCPLEPENAKRKYQWCWTFPVKLEGSYWVETFYNGYDVEANCPKASTCDNRDVMEFVPFTSPTPGVKIKVSSKAGYAWIDLHKGNQPVTDDGYCAVPEGYAKCWRFKDTSLNPVNNNYKFLINDNIHYANVTAPNVNQVCKTGTYVSTGTINGRVYDDPTADCTGASGMGGATVTLGTSPVTTKTTGANGNFQMTNLVLGTYSITAEKTGYAQSACSPNNITVEAGLNTVDLFLRPPGSWFQGKGGDMRMDNGFSDPVPLGNYALLDGEAGTPGVIFSGDSRSNFLPGDSSSKKWVAGGGLTYPEVFTPPTTGVMRTSYTYYTNLLRQSGITPTNLASACKDDNLGNCNLKDNLANGVYKADRNVTLKAYSFPLDKNYVILVNGNLTLAGNLLVPLGSTVIFSVSGNITVAKNVGQAQASSTNPNLEGFFSADQSFIIDGNRNCAGAADKRLNIEGAVFVNVKENKEARVGAGALENRRDLCSSNSQYPSFTISERPDFILNAPAFVKRPNFIWQEVAP